MKWFIEDDFYQKTVEKISKEVTDIIISQIKSAIDDKDAIEERAKAYSQSDDSAIVKAYKEGAMAQKAIDEQVRLKKCDDMTQEECDREAAFAEWYRENGKGTPTYSDAIEWARKEVINKACEWLDTYLMEMADIYDFRVNLLLSRVTKRLRKAMEE